ncbi:hypothetical protein HN747_04360 [archaeon]|jgi:hypothetical protein|nr:hypothetical protein [archaeon]
MEGSILSRLVSLVMWLTGVIVALAVGFGLIDGVLAVPYVGIVNVVAGWVVVVLTVIGVVLAVLDN